MKKINFLIITNFISIMLFSQNVTIVYQGSSLFNINTYPSTCNVFNQSGNNPTVGGIGHYPVSGGAIFDGVSIRMQTQFNVPSNIDNGTAYAINYTFKTGYNYKMSVDVGYSAIPSTAFPKITISTKGVLPSPSDSDPISCGPVNSNKYLSSIGNIILSFFPSAPAISTYQVPQFQVPIQQNFAIFTVSNGGTNGTTALINKITIEETQVALTSFLLTPSTVAIVKGTSTTQTFTVNNVNNTPGVTGYTWNIGATPNGWLYGGTPAPATISTTSNTISLSSVACANSVKNISASANIGTSTYPTNTCNVSLSDPTYNITGPNLVCTASTQTYILNPSGCAIMWSVSNPLVTFTASGNTVNVSTNSLSIGSFNLTATVPGVNGNIVITKPINVGAPSSISGVSTTYNVLKCIVRIYKFTLPDNTGATNFKWFSRNITQPTPFVQFKNGPDNWATRGGDGSCDQTEIKVETTNACNTLSPQIFTFPSDLCPPFYDGSCALGRAVVASPNPSISDIQLSLVEEENVKPKNTQPLKIEIIRIVDKSGQIRKTINGNKLQTMKIDISDLPADVYTIMVSDGKSWMSTPISKK